MIFSTIIRVFLGIIVWFSLVVFSYMFDGSLRSKEYDTFVSGLIFFSIVIFAALLCLEMLVHNPHKGIYSNIAIDTSLYFGACVLGCKLGRENGEKKTILERVSVVLLALSFLAYIPAMVIEPDLSSIPAEYLEKDGQTVSIDREVTKSVKLASINDSYQINGRGSFLSYVVNSDGYYQYYYYDEHGAIRQGRVDAYDDVRIFEDCEENEIPRLDDLRSYKVSYTVFNKQLLEKESSIYRWQEIHVPKGSVLLKYNFDLQ